MVTGGLPDFGIGRTGEKGAARKIRIEKIRLHVHAYEGGALDHGAIERHCESLQFPFVIVFPCRA